MKIHPFKIQRA